MNATGDAGDAGDSTNTTPHRNDTGRLLESIEEQQPLAPPNDHHRANDEAESSFSNKLRTSEGAQLSERRGGGGGGATSDKHQKPVFGLPLQAERQGNFPDPGSVLGHFFCVGKLGAGTFSSIHKCINLDYFSNTSNRGVKRRLAAAKIELSDFSNSGVLESEAIILDFLYQKLPAGSVPVYMGHYKSGEYAAIMMEYLPGADMHHLRETVMAGMPSRRIHVEDAVYLTAEVMLPLLQEMHNVGMVHRDVKPSNCVRSGTTPEDKSFCLVDFGLSKSIVVPSDSALADGEHPWNGNDWMKPRNYDGSACYRKEREKAEFRGTSMYASVRVHQMKDYCPRDDMWSVLYVFCDLISGGLPWMSHAAERKRDMCQNIKETVHGEGGNGRDETEQLLMGDEYHIAKYRSEQRQAAGDGSPHDIPEPLAMSKDEKKVNLLRTAFRHLAGLKFWEKPDYDLIKRCITGFLDDPSTFPEVKRIDWQHLNQTEKKEQNLDPRGIPAWELLESIDPIDSDIFDEQRAEQKPRSSPSVSGPLSLLPLRVQFKVSQLNHHVSNRNRIPIHLVLRDWLDVVLPLLYDEWNATNFEEGGHRTLTDGYRRDTYLLLLRKCMECAEQFQFFQSPDSVFESSGDETNQLGRKRKINADGNTVLTTVARAIFCLEQTIREEETKRSAPPRILSFGK